MAVLRSVNTIAPHKQNSRAKTQGSCMSGRSSLAQIHSNDEPLDGPIASGEPIPPLSLAESPNGLRLDRPAMVPRPLGRPAQGLLLAVLVGLVLWAAIFELWMHL